MQLSIPVADVDTPTALYTAAAVVVEDRLIVVRNRVGVILEILNLDDDVEEISPLGVPTLRAFRATIEGAPVIVRQSAECACKGTRRQVK